MIDDPAQRQVKECGRDKKIHDARPLVRPDDPAQHPTRKQAANDRPAQSTNASTVAIRTAAPSSSDSTEATNDAASTNSNRLGRQQVVATNNSKETPPIKKGSAIKGTTARKSANTRAAALNNLLTKT